MPEVDGGTPRFSSEQLVDLVTAVFRNLGKPSAPAGYRAQRTLGFATEPGAVEKTHCFFQEVAIPDDGQVVGVVQYKMKVIIVPFAELQVGREEFCDRIMLARCKLEEQPWEPLFDSSRELHWSE